MDRYGRNNDYRGNAHIPPSVYISSRKAHYRNDDPSSRTQQSLQSNTTSPTTNGSPSLHQQYPLVTNVPKPVVKKIYIEKIPRSSNDDVQMESNKPRKIYEIVPPIGSQPSNISLVLPTNTVEQTNAQLFSGQYHYPPESEETEINENDPENTDMKSVVSEFPGLSPPELLSLEQLHREQSALLYDRALIFVPEYVDSMERELTETTVDFRQSNPVDTDMARSLLVPSSKNSELSNKLKILNFPALIRTAPKIKPPPVPKPIPEPKPKSAPKPIPEPKPKSAPKPIPEPKPKSAPKPKPAPKPKVVPKSVEVPNKVKPNLTNTMLHKPVKHTRISIIEAEKKPSPPPPPPQEAIVKTKNNIDVDKAHFFSDFGKEGEEEEEVISIDSIPFVLPAQSEITTDDNRSSVVVGQSQPSPPTIQNNNKHNKEKKTQRIYATKKHSIISTPKLPAKKSVPISTYGKMETKFPWDVDNSNKNRVDMFSFGFNIGAFELPRGNGINNAAPSQNRS